VNSSQEPVLSVHLMVLNSGLEVYHNALFFIAMMIISNGTANII
jgi:hypothetical protein